MKMRVDEFHDGQTGLFFHSSPELTPLRFALLRIDRNQPGGVLDRAGIRIAVDADPGVDAFRDWLQNWMRYFAAVQFFFSKFVARAGECR